MANAHLGVRLAKSEIWNSGDGTNIAEVSERKFQQPSNITIHEVNVGGSVYLTPVSSRLFSKQGNLASYGSPYVILICAPQGKAAMSITGPFHSPYPSSRPTGGIWAGVRGKSCWSW